MDLDRLYRESKDIRERKLMRQEEALRDMPSFHFPFRKRRHKTSFFAFSECCVVSDLCKQDCGKKSLLHILFYCEKVDVTIEKI